MACSQVESLNLLSLILQQAFQSFQEYFPARVKSWPRTKVAFRNHFGIELAGDLYTPEEIPNQVRNDKGEVKFAALAISGPFGAVKEQSSGFYANQMASRGYVFWVL